MIRHTPRTGLAYVGIRFLVYAVAFAGILAIYSMKQRGLILGPAIGLVCVAGSWYLLGDTSAEPRWRLLLALVVGAVVGEFSWAVGYWSVVWYVGGALLWLAFYVLSGVIEHYAAGALDRRILLEYSLVAVIGALFVMLTTPWRA